MSTYFFGQFFQLRQAIKEAGEGGGAWKRIFLSNRNTWFSINNIDNFIDNKRHETNGEWSRTIQTVRLCSFQ